MGSVCCIASRDSSVTNGPTNEVLHRNIRHSPSWNFRWDTRVRVVGDESSLNWTSTGVPRFNQQENKSGPAVENALVSLEDSPLENSQLPVIQKSLEDSPLENSQLPVIQKSPVAELSAGSVGLPLSDLSIGGNSSEVKQSTESSEVSLPSPMKLSPVLSLSSQSVSPPLASQGHPLPPSSTPSRRPGHSPGHKLQRQVSDSLIPVIKSPTFSISEETSSFALPGWSYESTKGSLGGSSGSWSVPAFPDMMTTSHRERWSSDSETLGFARDKITQSSGRSSGCELDLQTCGICAKLLTEKSSWGTQKIIGTNELAVVAVLICGHVYHAECLENMTPEINKYDPACPVCTYGEKQVFKMSEKALKAELDLRSRKKSKKRIADGDLSGDLLLFDRQKSNGKDGRSQKLSASSSTKRSLGMPFLRRHFSLGGSKGSHSLENHSSRKRGFFWSKSSKH